MSLYLIRTAVVEFGHLSWPCKYFIVTDNCYGKTNFSHCRASVLLTACGEGLLVLRVYALYNQSKYGKSHRWESHSAPQLLICSAWLALSQLPWWGSFDCFDTIAHRGMQLLCRYDSYHSISSTLHRRSDIMCQVPIALQSKFAFNVSYINAPLGLDITGCFATSAPVKMYLSL